MRYVSVIRNKTAHEWGMDIKLAYLFSWIYELPSWSEKVLMSDKVFYFASRHKAILELPLLTDKPDTMYRYYVKLQDLGLIVLKRIDGKDYIQLTEKGQTWTDSSEHSEIYPSKVGNPSENNSEIYPTNKEYNINTNTNDNKKQEISLFPLKDLHDEEKKEKGARGKFLFSNSKFSKYDEVRSYLAANQSYRERYAGADLREYIHAVGTWSDKKNVMTTDRGWIAHIRSFMDRDKDAGKLKMRAEKGKENKKVLEPHEALKLGVHTNF